MYVVEVDEVAVSNTLTVIVAVSIFVSGITYIWSSVVSPTKNVLVFFVPSLIGIEVLPADVLNENPPLPSLAAEYCSVVWNV